MAQTLAASTTPQLHNEVETPHTLISHPDTSTTPGMAVRKVSASSKLMPEQASAMKALPVPKVTARSTKKGWQEQMESQAVRDKDAEQTVNFKKLKRSSKAKQLTLFSTVRCNVVWLPESELIRLPVTAVQPPVPKHDEKCSTSVELVQLVDVPQVVPTPTLSSTTDADVLVERSSCIVCLDWGCLRWKKLLPKSSLGDSRRERCL